MPSQLVIISEREEDLRFGEFVAFANNIPSVQAVEANEIKSILAENPNSVVFWGADDPETVAPIAEVLGSVSSTGAGPARTFAITDEGLNAHPNLMNHPVFGHHILRRFDDPAPILYAKLAAAVQSPYPFNLLRYFPQGAISHKIKLTRSGQKYAAVEAIQSHLKKQDVVSRLAALVAQACDELIMNALFDAPVLPDGRPLRRGTDRKADFELIEREHIEVDIATYSQYVGVCVADKFGSLKKEVVLRFLGKDYQQSEYVPHTGDPGAGLGLHGIVQTGLSLIFVSKPGVRTEVMLFFPKTENYRKFRMGFRFVSILSQ